jgi:hypothetical protein
VKVYVSGPMTGYEDYNRPAFHRATRHLRDLGFTVVNPAELDEADGSAEEIQSHAWYLKRDIAALLTCDAIYLLPGWKHSKGATLEKQVADGCGIFEVIDPDPALWRTFEGEPVDTDDFIEAEDSPAEEGPSEGRPEVAVEDLSGHPQWGDVGYMVDDSLPPNVVRIDYGTGHVDFEATWDEHGMHLHRKEPYLLADVEAPQPGDEFPDVGYVRRMLALLQRGETEGTRRSA